MILSQYQVSKKYKNTKSSMSVTALRKKSRIIPRPAYFVDMKGYDAPCVDIDHPDFKNYLKTLELKKLGQIENNSSSNDLINLINAMGTVITKNYGEDEAERIKNEIIGELKG